ncbi:hypothetical protein BLOT_010687 [Blomia tropicalis]|nr:hypothetical protein BLOT_010687 [Blomia tropicalis]
MASAGFYRFFRDISSQTQQRMVNIGSSMQSVFDNINGISTSNNNDTTLTTNNSPVNNSTVNVNEQSSINTNLCENSSPTNSTTECSTNLTNSSTTCTINPRRSSRRSTRSNRSSHSSSYPPHSGLISIRTLDKDRNVLAAILSIVVIVILATALAQFKWFSIYNDLCDSHFYTKSDSDQVSIVNEEIARILELNSGSQSPNEQSPNSIANQYQTSQSQSSFVFSRPFHSTYSSSASAPLSSLYGLGPSYRLTCVTPQILALKRTIIGLCFLAIMCSLIQFFMDIIGTKRKWVNSMRSHAVGNIITVLLCVLIIGLCYFVSILYERAQLHQLFRRLRQAPTGMLIKHYMMKPAQMDKNQIDILTVHQVKFELSYYLVTLAGFLSILAAAANLFRRPRQILIERINHRQQHHRNYFNGGVGDESLLLSSDLLGTADHHPHHHPITSASNYFSFYHPNGWMYNPNWNACYNLDANGETNPNGQSSRNGSMLPFTAPITNCPPPPPYTP